jgi:hypothetical protein
LDVRRRHQELRPLGFGVTEPPYEAHCPQGSVSRVSSMVKLSHHCYRFWCANGAFHHHNAAMALKGYHYLWTNPPPYDYPDLTLSGGAGAAVLRTAWAAAGQYAASGPPPRTACALRCRSLAPDRGGDCRRILQHQQLDDNAAAEVPEYRGSDHKGLGHGVISTGGQLRSKLKLVDAKLSALSLSAGGEIGIQWVMFLTGCPEKKSIQCGWGLSSSQMPRTAFPPANSRTAPRVLGIVIHIGRQQH